MKMLGVKQLFEFKGFLWKFVDSAGLIMISSLSQTNKFHTCLHQTFCFNWFIGARLNLVLAQNSRFVGDVQ